MNIYIWMQERDGKSVKKDCIDHGKKLLYGHPILKEMAESGCAVACIQETKKESFDRKFIKSCCPKQFDNFAFSPSVGASGGILVVWNSKIFQGILVQSERFGLIISFSSAHTGQKWTLVVVYGPCQGEQRDLFVQWLYDLVIPDGELWLFLGDFNFIRSQENRNAPGGDVKDRKSVV